MKKICGTAAVIVMLTGLSGCGGSDTQSESPVPPTQGDVGTTEAPSPTESSGVSPATSIVSCKIDNGLPVAEVKVVNTTGAARVFSVEVQFENGDTILGSGMEYTRKLNPSQNQTVRMGSMQGDAKAVDSCKVIDASAIE